MQGWVGLDPEVPDCASEDARRCRLQRLAQRLLTSFEETVTIAVQGAMVSVAPTDVDVGAGVTWLPDAAFSGGSKGGSVGGESTRGAPGAAAAQVLYCYCYCLLY